MPIHSSSNPNRIGILTEPNSSASSGVMLRASAVPMRAQAISRPIANANSLPLNHLTIIFETVIPAISIPTPKMA